MEKKTNYYFGFYRDYSLKDRPVICQVVENVDCLSCELLGGEYPLIKQNLTKMDYLYIGSNGFAQVGEPDFHMKNKAEMAVLLDYLKTNFPVPEEFTEMCYYKVKWFQHDFGSYSEIVLIYDDLLVEQWETADLNKSNRFWSWFMQVEAVDLESDILTQEIESLYLKMTNVDEIKFAAHETQTR